MLILANGVFDLLHVSHVRHLEEARRMGTRLVVGVTRDKYVNKTGRPIIPENERKEMVEALQCVSDVILCDSGTDAIMYFQPDIFVKGDDYRAKGLLKEEIDLCTELDIDIKFTRPNKITTTSIIERIKCTS